MANKKIINTENAPMAIGPYSQAVIYDNLIFTSGQLPININTQEIISQDFKEQVYETLKNIENLIVSSGSSLDKILKLNVYLTDINNFSIVNDVFIDCFKKDFPARTLFEVSKLPKNSLIEIDAVCFK